jgi:hypothetical protein
MIAHARAFLDSPSTYPIATFWLVATVVLPLVAGQSIALNLAVGILTATATLLVFLAFKRDLDLVRAQHGELVDRVQQLTKALTDDDIPIPPIRPATHRKAI